MAYTVKEIFYTIQGEGGLMGRPAVFCRFSGCNLACSWCDTDFAGGERYDTADALADSVGALWPAGAHHRTVVLTGGEPALQVDAPLLAAFRERQFFTAIETNGTKPLPEKHLDWVCVSPKAGSPIIVTSGDELKLVFPQPGAEPGMFENDHINFRIYSLSPLDNLKRHAKKAAAYCLAHPKWRLGTRLHQTVGFP